MKRKHLALGIVGALLACSLLQGCAVNVITAPHASFDFTTNGAWQEHNTAKQGLCDAAVDSIVDEAGLSSAELSDVSVQNQIARLSWRCNEKLGNTL